MSSEFSNLMVQNRFGSIARRIACGAVAMIVAVSLGVPAGAASEAYADDSTQFATASALNVQSLGVFEKSIKLIEALPSASKATIANTKAYATAFEEAEDALNLDDASDSKDFLAMSTAERDRVSASWEKLSDVGEAIEKDAAKQTAATQKLKVKGVKVKAAKKAATVSWKNLGKKYKYQVYYSTKKNSGYKLAGSTSAKKLTVKKLKAGQKYYFKVRGYRSDIPWLISLPAFEDVYTKYSSPVRSASIK